MKQFNSLSEIADALEAGEITKDQAIEITEAGFNGALIVFIGNDRKPSGTAESVIKNLRSFDEKIKKGESGILLINL